MAAIVTIVEKNTTSGTATDKSTGNPGIRFKAADNATVDLLNPLVRPASGSAFSYDKWLRMNVTGGTYTQISNVRSYSDGTNGMGTGVNLWYKVVTNFPTGTGPQQASSTAGYSNWFGATSASPVSLGVGPFSGTGEKADHLVMMCEVQSTATGGLTSTEPLTVAWDEI